MFKQTRRKIVAVIMAVLAFLFLGTLTVIYLTSYTEMLKNNYEMLEHHTEMYIFNEGPDIIPDSDFEQIPEDPFRVPDFNKKPFDDNHSFKLSTFYSVALSDDGAVLRTDVGTRDVYQADALEAYATDIYNSGESRGTVDNLIYFVADKENYILVAFMDNTVIYESMNTLFRYTLIFGSIILVLFFFIAIFSAKKIVDPLEKSYKKQKQFVSDAGHELKTPLAVVNANAEILQREVGENQWLANILHENQRMSSLVSQLLDLARTENVKNQTQYLDFSRLVSGEVLPFESIAFEKGILIKTDIAQEIYLQGNPSQLSQLVSILTDNAISHGKENGEILVNLSSHRNTAVLSVINDGDLITKEKTEQLFERFYRVDDVRNGENNHYGLGLSIAKAIVEAHNGSIEVSCLDGKVKFTVKIQTA